MAPAEPSTARYIIGAITILLFLAIPFASLRLLAILPPLRPPPRKRARPSSTTDPGNLFQSSRGTAEKSVKPNSTTRAGSDDEEAAGEDEGPTRLLIVLGSGGHTAEMLSMLRKLDPERFLVDWAWRTYVVSEGDGFSAERAGEFEAGLVGRARRGGSGKGRMEGVTGDGEEKEDREEEEVVRGPQVGWLEERARCYDIRVVPRARRIHQSLLTAPWSALQCLWSCFSVLSSPSLTRSTTSTTSTTLYPSLILTNGPGTAVIVLLASLLLRFFDVRGANSSGRMRSVYIESWARVKKLSLSGRLVVRVVDRFVVQWEGLVERTGGRGEFLGVLV